MVDRMSMVYEIADGYLRRYPEGNDPFRILARLTEELGEVASDVHHLERDGGKVAKHGEPDPATLADEIEDLLHSALALVRHYGLEEQVDAAVASTHQHLVERGDIDPTADCVCDRMEDNLPGENLVLPNVYGLIKRRAGTGVLLQRRWKPETDPDNLGKWELPGGKWRAGESAQDCLRRELQEECGIDVSSVEGPFAQYEHLGQRVETSSPILLVQMLVGSSPSVLAVYSGYSDKQPSSQGDGARDASFMDVSELKSTLRQHPDSFTALSFAALTEILSRDLL